MCNDLRGQTGKEVEDLIMIQYLLVTKKLKPSSKQQQKRTTL